MCQLTQTLADLWPRNLFLGGTNMTDLRPFGKDVTLDGVDLDNETGNGTHYDTFMSTLTLLQNRLLKNLLRQRGSGG